MLNIYPLFKTSVELMIPIPRKFQGNISDLFSQYTYCTRHSDGQFGFLVCWMLLQREYIGQVILFLLRSILRRCFFFNLFRGKELKLIHWMMLDMCGVLYSWNRPISQIPQTTCSLSHNASFRPAMCTFLFRIVHCKIWNRSIVGFVK